MTVRYVLTASLLLLVVLVLSAATGSALISADNIARGALAGIGLWALHTLTQFYKRLETMLKRWPSVENALWGEPDPEGHRHGGLLKLSEQTAKEVTSVRKLIEEKVVHNPHDRTRSGDAP